MTLSISRLLLNPRNRLTSDSLSKGQAVLCNCYKELKLYEAVIVNRFNNYGDSVAILTPEQEQEKLIIVSMHGILLMYHRVMDDWDMMSVEQEYDHSEMAHFFGSEKEEEVAAAMPFQEQQVLIVEEEPSVIAFSPVSEDIIYTSILRCSPKAMKVLAVIIINRISPNTSQYTSRYRDCHWTWGHIMQALINLGLIDKKTSKTAFSRAMHVIVTHRTLGSIRSACNRYDYRHHVTTFE